MARTAILVPFPQMCDTARSAMERYPDLDIMCVEYRPTSEVADRAAQLKAEGCELIIARGLQALLIREKVDLPLVEMRVTAQELGSLVLQLKSAVQADRPVIAIIGFDNMISRTDRFNDLFGVIIRRYIVTRSEDLEEQAGLAIREGAQALIGGEIACGVAERLGIPHLPLPAEEESFDHALHEARQSGYAIDLQRRNSDEINSMLNNSPNGMLQLDRSGIIRRANSAACSVLQADTGALLNRPVSDILPRLDPNVLNAVLEDGTESYTTLSDRSDRAVIINASPIVVDDQTEGALLTLQEDAQIIEMEGSLRRELYRQGYGARYQFSDLVSNAAETKEMIATAKRIARFDAPILISGETGVGKTMIAQCIHKESLLRDNGFVSIDCSAWLPETADTMLFGTCTSHKDTPPCLAELAENGTLYISHVECLQMESQYRLLRLIRGAFLHNGNNSPSLAHVRVIASTEINLISRVERGEFRPDLYYALNVLSLEVLPLRQRRADILGWTDRYIKFWQKKYKRFIHLTDGARAFLEDYSWPGNLNQLDSVCERIILLTQKRNVDEVFLRKQLNQTAPQVAKDTGKVVLYKDPEGAELAAALRRHGGNREQTAAELGISKTTLWRRMKKYGIEKDFNY